MDMMERMERMGMRMPGMPFGMPGMPGMPGMGDGRKKPRTGVLQDFFLRLFLQILLIL